MKRPVVVEVAGNVRSRTFANTERAMKCAIELSKIHGRAVYDNTTLGIECVFEWGERKGGAQYTPRLSPSERTYTHRKRK